MSEAEQPPGDTYRFYRTRVALGKAIGLAICKPKLILGRRRHDGTCDRCGEPFGKYAGEKLDFPLDDLSPDASSTRAKLRAMWNAEYTRVCLECSVDVDSDHPEADHDD
ncbi:hypothetical protein A6E15_19260 [Natrinema saccharevitans]|uniref:Uncharacterized protein n=1 Tax=Natrinema saccharevitans TaxID=301967 RepID=A0A1S8ARD6_9EURY|nr:hypothetical protein [Natrinema saccharevitans]OLZ39104.1 hypothetical protein A6E15_19260 [Natrinema saccharevitans]